MANEPNDQTTRSGLQTFLQHLEHYLKVMFDECYAVLDSNVAAEDAVGETVIKAMRDLPEEITTSLEAWLRVVARNTARDLRRKLHSERVALEKAYSRPEMTVHPFRASQTRMDTELFLERCAGLVGESLQKDVGLYFELWLGDVTEKELAKQQGITLNALKDRRRRGRAAGKEAATVVCLIASAGDGPDQCPDLLDLVKDLGYTPELLKKVRAHLTLTRCKPCRRRRGDNGAHFRTIFVIPVAIVWNLLDRMRTNAKTTVTVAVVTAAIILFPVITGPDPAPAPPIAVETIQPTGTRGIEPAPLPTTPPPTTSPTTTPGPSTSDPTKEPTIAPPPATTQPETTTATPPPDPTEQPRDNAPPSVTDHWIQHDRIATTKNGTCPTDEPMSSAVRVTVNRGASSVELLITRQGRTASQQMADVGDGITWDSRVGPFFDGEHGSVTVAVRVVDANGVSVTQQLGEICVTPCRWNSSE